MLHFLTMFLAPAAAPPQATTDLPPALRKAGRKRLALGPVPWKLAASVLGNAAGFLALVGGCWLLLQVLQALLRG